MAPTQSAPVSLPRVAITYCTQCRWMLRAAYFGQELLSTFGTQIGEIALIPATGGLFAVELTYIPSNAGADEGHNVEVQRVLLWDRKTEGGFPDTKVLKQRVRDHIDPSKDLGHSDRHGKKKEEKPEERKAGQIEGHATGILQVENVPTTEIQAKKDLDGTICEDCR